jgi:hypothetical protein
MISKSGKCWVGIVTISMCLLYVSSAYPQRHMENPINRDQLFKSLRENLTETGLEHLIRRVEEWKVSFQISDVDDREIRKLQNHLPKERLDDLIGAIHENYRAPIERTNPDEKPTGAQPEAKPNIIPVSFRKLYITYDPPTQTFREADAGILAVAAQFRNAHEQGKQICDAKDIRAHVYFEPFDFYKNLDRTIPGFANVEEGIWLNEKTALVNFERGETKTLVLVIQMQGEKFGGFDAFEHQMRTLDGRELFLPKIPILTADKYLVKVQITGGVKGELAELHHFIITLRPEFNISSG